MLLCDPFNGMYLYRFPSNKIGMLTMSGIMSLLYVLQEGLLKHHFHPIPENTYTAWLVSEDNG